MRWSSVKGGNKVAKVVMFYDRSIRLWTLFKQNKQGHQIGDAEYEHHKEDALELKRKWEKQYHIEKPKKKPR